MVFAPAPVDLNEAPVVYTRVGRGYLGYIGDVNGEEESTNVILSMLGLPAQSTKIQKEGLRRAGKGKGSSRSAGRSGGEPGLGKGKGRASGSRYEYHDSEDDWYSDEEEERMMNGGFSNDELNELLCQGIKPWEEW